MIRMGYKLSDLTQKEYDKRKKAIKRIYDDYEKQKEEAVCNSE